MTQNQIGERIKSSKNRDSAPEVSPAPEIQHNLGLDLEAKLKKSRISEERFLDGEDLEKLLKKELLIQQLEGNPIGSLKRHLEEWEKLGCAPTVVMWIRDGTPLFFKQHPQFGGGRKNYVPIAAMQFANEEITRLWVIKAIEEDPGLEPGYIFPLGQCRSRTSPTNGE